MLSLLSLWLTQSPLAQCGRNPEGSQLQPSNPTWTRALPRVTQSHSIEMILGKALVDSKPKEKEIPGARQDSNPPPLDH